MNRRSDGLRRKKRRHALDRRRKMQSDSAAAFAAVRRWLIGTEITVEAGFEDGHSVWRYKCLGRLVLTYFPLTGRFRTARGEPGGPASAVESMHMALKITPGAEAV